MATQNLSEHVLLLTLPTDPQASGELAAMARPARSMADRDVVVDFSLVASLPWLTISYLIILERTLSAAGRRLVLCCISPGVKEAFRRAGLHNVFQFAGDEVAARASLG